MGNQLITVDFYGKGLETFEHNGEPYVAMKPVVEGMGLDWASQYVKLKQDGNKFNHCVINMVAKDGKNRDVVAMPLKKLNGWLFSINPNKVRSDTKEVVEFYQERCFEVLHDYWHKGMAVQDALLDDEVLFKKAYEQAKENKRLKAENSQLNQTIEAQEPKVALADSLLVSKDTILVRLMAKLITQTTGYKIGEKQFYEWLRENGYLIRKHGDDYNTPTQRYQEMGLFKVKEFPYFDGEGNSRISKTTKITTKGQAYFINKFKKIMETEEV